MPTLPVLTEGITQSKVTGEAPVAVCTSWDAAVAAARLLCPEMALRADVYGWWGGPDGGNGWVWGPLWDEWSEHARPKP